MLIVILIHEAAGDLLIQRLDLVVVYDEELLICRRVEVQSVSLLCHDLLHAHRSIYRALSDPEVQLICEERVELDAREPSFGAEREVALDQGREVLRHVVLGEDKSLAAEGAALCTADIENIAELSYLRKCQICSRTCKGICEPCSVHVERDIPLAADRCDLFKLGFCI